MLITTCRGRRRYATRHDGFNDAFLLFFGFLVVLRVANPFRAEIDAHAIEIDADAAAPADDHGFAIERSDVLLAVGEDDCVDSIACRLVSGPKPLSP